MSETSEINQDDVAMSKSIMFKLVNSGRLTLEVLMFKLHRITHQQALQADLTQEEVQTLSTLGLIVNTEDEEEFPISQREDASVEIANSQTTQIVSLTDIISTYTGARIEEQTAKIILLKLLDSDVLTLETLKSLSLSITDQTATRFLTLDEHLLLVTRHMIDETNNRILEIYDVQ